MMIGNREKILLLILGGLLVMWQGAGLVQSNLLEPITRRRQVLRELRVDLAELEIADMRKRDRDNQLAEWSTRSLPGDAITAQRMYQQWLVDLATELNIADATPSTEQRIEKDGWSQVQVRMTIQGQPTKVSRFLHRWRQADLLHRIIDLEVSRVESQLRLDALFEAACLDGNSKTSLFSQAVLGDALSRDDGELTVEEASDSLKTPALIRLGGEYMEVTATDGHQWTVQRGIDSQPAEHEARQPIMIVRQNNTTSPDLAEGLHLAFGVEDRVTNLAESNEEKAVQIDELEHQFLVATILQGNSKQAWLYNRLNNRTVIIAVGSRMLLGDLNVTVEEITEDFIEFADGVKRFRMRIGTNLRNATAISLKS